MNTGSRSAAGAKPAKRCRIVVLASGNGSNFQAIIDGSTSGRLDADVVGLITDRPDAHAVHRARAAGIPLRGIIREGGEDRKRYDTRLAEAVGGWSPDLVVLAGWMRLLSMEFLGRFPQRVVNLHPALPGEFPGTRAVERALEAAQRFGLRRTGVMVHHVPDEGMDDGPVIATCEVVIDVGDTIESLTARVGAAEHDLIVRALQQLVTTAGG